LIGRDSFLILNLRLDVVNSIRRLHIKSLYWRGRITVSETIGIR
jgi:hypothetical protein